MTFPYERFKDMIGFLFVVASILIGVSATLMSNIDPDMLKNNHGPVAVEIIYTPFVISFLALIVSTGIFIDVARTTATTTISALAGGGKKEKDTWYSRNSNVLAMWLVQAAITSSFITILLLLLASK